jgi:two-component system, NtrC family, sensor kinase
MFDERTIAVPALWRTSVRFRLLAIALLPMLVVLPLLLGLTMARWNAKFNALLISKVNGDLTIAHEYLARILEHTGQDIRALGNSARFRDIAQGRDRGELDAFLEASRKERNLDFLLLVNEDAVLAAAPSATGGTVRLDWPVIAAALDGQAQSGIDIFDGEGLRAIAPALAERARLRLVPTANAAPTERLEETRGMVVHSAAPVAFGPGKGALVGGTLLNHNLDFIDTINDLVYRALSLPEGSQGTATLFLDDVRISTNVRLFEEKRALGTRVSNAVRGAVLGDGRVWLDSAFVVNDWYISAYEPITDSYGKRVGMLYVGFLEAPFVRAKIITLVGIGLAFLVITAASVPIFLRWARGIFEPLELMTGTIRRVESGDLGARSALPGASDEIGRVALHLNGLLDQLEERDRELRSWNEVLNVRVQERTQELELANRRLEATTRQLIMSEKMAAIGEITAGVAHEMNNPIAVVQGNLEVARELLGERAAVASTEFRLIDEQIDRMSQIVMKVLQSARPEEYAGYVERHAPAEVISGCLPLVRHLLQRAGIALARDDRATRLVLMNRTELQQVLVNLIVNAIHAMPDGGTLTLRSYDAPPVNGQSGIAIEVADTGIGMTPEVIAKIFDPFFTTRRSEGTGLGLSLSQALIARQNGLITVQSTSGQGAVFTVWLPEAA